MRRPLVIFLISLLHVSATVYPQDDKISVSMNGVTVKEVLRKIESLSDYRFIYQNEQVELNEKISVRYKDKKIEQILDEIFDGENIEYSITASGLILIKSTRKQQYDTKSDKQTDGAYNVSGIVSDISGAPLPGVTVFVKKGTLGTVTNTEGKYELSLLPDSAVLVFSFIGMKTSEIPVQGRNSINVTMEQNTIGIEEVVAVGYGVAKKVNLTGSVAAVQGNKLMNKPVTGTLDALQGILPGVVVSRSSGSPGQEDFNLQVRGITSVNNNAVLVLVDGIEGNIGDVRPEDIESISVLKDAASAAIYGAKAAGGVILINTKRGNSGKISIQVNSYYSMAKLGRTQDRISSYNAAKMRNEADVNAGSSATVSEEDLAKFANPNILWEPSLNNPNLYVFYGDYDYEDLVLHDFSTMMSHNISFSGGTDKLTFWLSTTYFDNKGQIKIGPDSNSQYSGRLNLDFKINKNFHLANSISYKNNYIEKPWRDIDGRYGLFGYVFWYTGATPLRDPNGHLTIGERIGNFDTRVKFYDYSYERGIRKWDENNVRFNSTLTISNLIKGLQFRLVGGIDANFNKLFEHEKSIPKYGIDNSVVGVLAWGNSVKRAQVNTSFKEFQFLADYNLKINSHSITALAGYSFQDYHYTAFDAYAASLINRNLPDFDWASVENTQLNDRVEFNKFQSIFGRISYNYDERYLFETNLRYDGSSKLAPNRRYRCFPSASLGWRINNENWFSSNFISELKVRGSYGQLGNAGVLGDYDYIPLLQVNDNLLLGYDGENVEQVQYVYQQTLASQNITWETIQSTNIGIDLGFYGNKLTMTGDYFVKYNKDMLANVTYPSVIGINVSNLNVGKLRTWGWEASIGFKERRNRFNYWINMQISDSKNELVDYTGADVFSLGTVRLLEGYPVNSIFGYKTDGLFQSSGEVKAHAFQSNVTGAGDVKYVDINNDSRINVGDQTYENHGDLVYLGNNSSRYNFGFEGGFQWKDFDFSFFLQGVGKRVFLVDEILIMPFLAPWFGPQQHNLDYWTPKNTDAYWPRLYNRGEHNFLPSDKWLQNAAYIRLKDIQLGYNVPNSILSKWGIEKLRFYISGHDIWELTNSFKMIDPESPNESTYKYPFRRYYTVGINFKF